MGLTIEEYDLRTTYRTEKRLLQFVGLYPNGKNDRLFVLAATINFLFCLAQILSMLIQMVIARNDLLQLADSLEYFMTIVTYTSKLVNFVGNKRKLFDIEHTLTSPILYDFSKNDLVHIQKKVGSCQNLAKVFRLCCATAIILYTLTPFFSSQEKSLPSWAWFPYNVTRFRYPTYVFQAVGAANVAYGNSTFDVLTWMLIIVAAGQLEILKANLKNINFDNRDSKMTEKRFKKCVQHHKEIIKLVDQIETLFSKGIFIQFLASIIIMCFVGFMLLILPVNSSQFAFVVMYFCCMMCEVAMYCWYGHDVITTSSTIGESLYISNWYESHLSTRKSVIIFMEKTKKPVYITAGGYFNLSLTTLTLIMRSAYSYIAVLQRVYDSNF